MAWKARKSDCLKAIERLNEKLSYKYNMELCLIYRRNRRNPFALNIFDLEGNLVKGVVTGHLQEVNMYLGGMEFVCSLGENEGIVA
jgi:hypothetical protein